MKSIKQPSTFKNKGKFGFQLEEFSAPTQTIAPIEYDFIFKKYEIYRDSKMILLKWKLWKIIDEK